MIIKTHKILSASLILLVLTTFIVTAAVGDNLDYDKLKQNTITVMDIAINKIDNAKNVISNNPKIDETIKNNIITNLTNIENKLTNYKIAVEGTTTLAELNQLNMEIIQYIKDNKEVIRNNIKMALINLGQKTAEKAKELEDNIKFMLNILERTCTSEAGKINEVQGQLTQLDAHIVTLKTAVQSKDTTTIKTEVKAIYDLSKIMIVNMKEIKQVCLPEI